MTLKEQLQSAAEYLAKSSFTEPTAKTCLDAIAELEALEARVKELCEALKPFSQEDLLIRAPNMQKGDESVVWARNFAELKLGDFKKAKALLAKYRTQSDN